jgi:transposase-like protein
METRPPADFKPPFCPRPTCPFHTNPQGWRYKKTGFHHRLSHPQSVQRFLCLHCRRSFSTQTFSTTYWLKRPDLLKTLFHRTLQCSAYRQVARELDVDPTTVQRQVERLGRHCLLFQELHRPKETPRETLVLDGFESFEFSQYYPCHFHVAAGAETHFFYAFTDSELRRKGRMTRAQKIRRDKLEFESGRPDPKSIEKEVAELVKLVVRGPGQLRVQSDEHRAYPRAFRRVRTEVRIEHAVTPSKASRTPANPLFPANLLDLLIRHSGGNHKRETIAYSKRRQGGAERLAILQVWRNFVKSISERKKNESPAQLLGLFRRRLRVEEILSKRLFPSLIELPARIMKYYRREIRTRRIPNCRRHTLKYAF